MILQKISFTVVVNSIEYEFVGKMDQQKETYHIGDDIVFKLVKAVVQEPGEGE